MSIVAADLILYGSASRPSDDSSTTGGAISTTDRPEFTQLSTTSVVAVVSDGADTRTVTVQGRNAGGSVVSEVLNLNGTTEVVGSTSFERILTLTASATSASRTITVREGSGGATRATIAVNETTRTSFFRQSASSTSQVIRYEKAFWKNTHATLTLNSAAIMLTSDTASRIRIGAAPSVNDTATVANRVAAPSSVSFSDDNVSVGVPGGALAAGDAIGMWVEQTLPASDSAWKTSFTTQLSGTTV